MRSSYYVNLKQAELEIGQRKRARLAQVAGRLRTLSPRATLERGYAIVRSDDRVLRSVAAIDPGDALEVELVDGRVGVRAE